MFARRFTIVCLIVTIFGMSLSILVAEKSRPTRHSGLFGLSCDMTRSNACPSPFRR